MQLKTSVQLAHSEPQQPSEFNVKSTSTGSSYETFMSAFNAVLDEGKNQVVASKHSESMKQAWKQNYEYKLQAVLERTIKLKGLMQYLEGRMNTLDVKKEMFTELKSEFSKARIKATEKEVRTAKHLFLDQFIKEYQIIASSCGLMDVTDSEHPLLEKLEGLKYSSQIHYPSHSNTELRVIKDNPQKPSTG